MGLGQFIGLLVTWIEPVWSHILQPTLLLCPRQHQKTRVIKMRLLLITRSWLILISLYQQRHEQYINATGLLWACIHARPSSYHAHAITTFIYSVYREDNSLVHACTTDSNLINAYDPDNKLCFHWSSATTALCVTNWSPSASYGWCSYHSTVSPDQLHARELPWNCPSELLCCMLLVSHFISSWPWPWPAAFITSHFIRYNTLPKDWVISCMN